jgi:uncharacterized protein (UPF0276 family)
MRIEGIGLGLRQPLARELFDAAPPALSWLEIHPENYLGRGGQYARLLAVARERWPLITHGLTLGFGSLRPYDARTLAELARFLHELDVPFHSDHLCIASVDGVYLHDLLPLPFSESATEHAVKRIRELSAAIARPVAVEHISYYARAPLDAAERAYEEAEQLCALLERADARLLLDVNNVYVNASNHGFDARGFIDRLPLERVVQLHVAGHQLRADGFRIDTHAEPICEEVYALFEYTMQRLARPVPVLLERDDNFPPFSELVAELTRLDEIYRSALVHVAGARANEERVHGA